MQSIIMYMHFFHFWLGTSELYSVCMYYYCDNIIIEYSYNLFNERGDSYCACMHSCSIMIAIDVK